MEVKKMFISTFSFIFFNKQEIVTMIQVKLKPSESSTFSL